MAARCFLSLIHIYTFSDSTWKDLTKAIAAAEDAITAADGDVNTVHGLKAEVALSLIHI